jgi:hypothetical protein
MEALKVAVGSKRERNIANTAGQDSYTMNREGKGRERLDNVASLGRHRLSTAVWRMDQRAMRRSRNQSIPGPLAAGQGSLHHASKAREPVPKQI